MDLKKPRLSSPVISLSGNKLLTVKNDCFAVLLSRTWDSRTRTRTRTWCPRTSTWKLVLENPRGQGLSSRTPGSSRNTELSEYQPYTSYVIATPALTPAQSVDTDSLLSPRKFSRTWTSEEEDKYKNLKIGPRGSSRTRTFLEDNNTAVFCSNLAEKPALYLA